MKRFLLYLLKNVIILLLVCILTCHNCYVYYELTIDIE